jgi:hypothetical protein
MTPSLIYAIAKKDFYTSLGVWTALEMICFVVLPLVGLVQPESKLQGWFYASFPLGIGGALVIGLSSWWIAVAIRKSQGWVRVLRVLLGEVVSLVGVAAIAYPLLVGSMELFKSLFASL